MARKRHYLSDEDSSGASSSDPDLSDGEDSEFKRKKPRRGGKEDAYLGVFAEDEEEEEDYKTRGGGRKPKYTK